jgi:hypothetical protein
MPPTWALAWAQVRMPWCPVAAGKLLLVPHQSVCKSPLVMTAIVEGEAVEVTHEG